MRLKSRGLGRKELVMDFREYNVVRDGKEIVIEGTITEPVHWDFTIRMCQDDLPGIAKVALRKVTIGFLLKAMFTRNKDAHWREPKDKATKAGKAEGAKVETKGADATKKPVRRERTTIGAGSAAPVEPKAGGGTAATRSEDRSAKLAEAKARASKASAATAAPAPSKAAASTTAATAAAPESTAATSTPDDDAPKPAPAVKREDDRTRGLLKPSTGNAPKASEFSTGKSVSFAKPAGAKAPAPTPAKESGGGSPEQQKSDEQQPSGEPKSDEKTKKTTTGTKTAANGGSKSLAPAEGTQ